MEELFGKRIDIYPALANLLKQKDCGLYRGDGTGGAGGAIAPPAFTNLI